MNCWMTISQLGSCMHAKLLQLCLTLCDPMGGSLPSSSVHGIFQARILEWVAMPSSGDLPNSGIELASLTSPALAGSSLPPAPPGKPYNQGHQNPILCIVNCRGTLGGFLFLVAWMPPVGINQGNDHIISSRESLIYFLPPSVTKIT